MTDLESRVAGFIQRNNLIPPGETLVVGVSGGADSVCLLCLLQKCQDELGIKLHVAHLNHGLRGVESEGDARYVAELASSFSLPIAIDRQDVAAYQAKKRCSLEEAARELRYVFFAQVAEKVGARRVAVGHTRDDQVETVLMHILRGTGTSGLHGLKPCSSMPFRHFCHSEPLRFCHSERSEESYQRSGQAPANPELSSGLELLIIRPLLDIARKETQNYCQERGLSPRSDSSNVSLSFLRNRLRLELLPLLRKYNPNINEALLRLAEIARDDGIFIEEQSLKLWNEVAKQQNGVVYLDRIKIAILPVALQRQLIKLAITRVLGDIRDIEANHIEAARDLLGKPVGKRFSLPHGLVCQTEYSEIVIMASQSLDKESLSLDGRGLGEGEMGLLFPCPSPFPPLQGEFSLKVPGESVLPGWRVLANIVERRALPVIATLPCPSTIAEFDLHQTRTELFCRQRQPGDKFQPLGMSMPKKLQDFMVDAKIHLSWRGCIPIVCSPGQIIWVVGYRIDDRVKVTEGTTEILRLEFIRLV